MVPQNNRRATALPLHDGLHDHIGGGAGVLRLQGVQGGPSVPGGDLPQHQQRVVL